MLNLEFRLSTVNFEFIIGRNMATYTVYITLLSALIVLYLPCPLIAIKSEKLKDAVDEYWFEQCYKGCIREQGRFPCEKDSFKCGECLYPLTTLQDGKCKEIPHNDEIQEKILDFISKRDGGLRLPQAPNPPIEVEKPPSLDPVQPAPDADTGELLADADPAGGEVGGGGPDQGVDEQPNIEGDLTNFAEKEALASDIQDSNAQVEVEQTENNNGSVILLEEWQFILIVVGCVVVAIICVAVAFFCWYKIQTTSKAQNEADYPSYGVTGPGTQLASSMNNGDRKLAQSAQMYHYQHQKQQMIAMEKREKGDVANDASEYDSEEENEEGDLTVYECPGLAPTGEMQVKNPLFAEESYPKPGGQEEGEQKQ
ncbi:neural proliferation differentiation and control protein 1-like [Diadema setosum]|uniref:neural proliferation differentiation and control protein 1-like n=1 Tax=Diadema setosum TaxID=31175 RepID=UPI003B3A29D8